MAKKSGIYRLSVSITQDLKRRMDKVADQVNWSATAAAAFESKLAEIAARKEKKDMTDVVQRLRASKLETANEVYKDGFATGQEWAKDTANAAQLVRLERWRTACGADWDTVFEIEDHGYNNASRSLAETVAEIEGRHSIDEFWETAVGDDLTKIEDGPFVHGFAEGALAVWDEVKSQL